jgi:hypothetical protein
MKRFFTIALCTLLNLSCGNLLDTTPEDSANKSDGNDKLTTATALILGQPQSMQIYPDEDIDFYSVNIVKGGVLNVVLGGVPDITIDLEVLNPEGTKLTYYYAANFNRTADTIRLPYLAKAGQYYISVSTGFSEESDKAFTITATMDTLDTLEWNNTTTTATPLTLDKTYRGTIFPKGDVDIFKLTIDTNQIVRFLIDSLSTKTDFNAFFSFLDFEGTRINYNYLTSGQLNTLVYSLQKGTYFLQLNDISDDAASELRYSIKAVKDTTDPTEWNDDTTHAYPISNGEIIKAAIIPANDADYFKFTLEQADTVHFSVDSISSKLSSFQMYVYDSELTVITHAYDDENRILRCKKFLNPGQYFVKLGCNNSYGAGESSEKQYYFTMRAGN